MKSYRKLLCLGGAIGLTGVMAGAAQAYVGDALCLSCHEPVSHPGDADKTSYLMTGHKNASRLVTPNVELFGPGGATLEYGHGGTFTWGETPTAGPVATCVTEAGGPDYALTKEADCIAVAGNTWDAAYMRPMYYLHHSWFEPAEHDGHLVSGSRAGVEGSAETCMPCHTTGYDISGGGTYPLVGWDVTTKKGYSMIDDTMVDGAGTWQMFGVQCEACHGERGVVIPTLVSPTYTAYELRTPGTADNDGDGDFCDYGDRVSTIVYSGDDGVTFVDENNASYPVPGTLCRVIADSVYDGHHNVIGGTDIVEEVEEAATSMEATLAVTGLCGECHLASHHNVGFLNSAHSGYRGPAYDLTAYGTESNYEENHFESYYGSCDACHDVHVTTIKAIDGHAASIKKGCADCHSPASPYTPDGGMQGFHDGLGGNAPSTLATEDVCLHAEAENEDDCATAGGEWHVVGDTGVNVDACVTCHMPGGEHFFAISTDPNYDPVAEGTGTVSHGHVYGIPGKGQVYVSLEEACLQCHGEGQIASASTPLTKEDAAIYAVDYHNARLPGEDRGAKDPGNTARLNWYYGSGCNQVVLDASDNDSPVVGWMTPGATAVAGGCYETLADDTKKALETCTLTFPSEGSYLVQVTLDDETHRTMVVQARENAAVPTVTEMTVDATDATDGMSMNATVKILDNSCGESGKGIENVMVMWGDGSMQILNEVDDGESPDVARTHTYKTVLVNGTTFDPHTYLVKGTYTVRATVKDKAGKNGYASPVTITVPDQVAGVFNLAGKVTADGCSYPDPNDDTKTIHYFATGDGCGDMDRNGQDASTTKNDIDSPTFEGYYGYGDGTLGLPGVTVTVKTAAGTVVAFGKTDSKGQYLVRNVQGLASGDYTVEFTKTGYEIDDATVNIDDDGTTVDGDYDADADPAENGTVVIDETATALSY